jgi:hypothetical protein
MYRVPAVPYPALPAVLRPRLPVDYLAGSGLYHPAIIVSSQPDGVWIMLTGEGPPTPASSMTASRQVAAKCPTSG